MPQAIRFAGVDEAGYGPNLGPLCVGLAAFDGPADLSGADWWSVLAPAVGRHARAAVRIDDSKKLFGTPAGNRAAAATVSAALHACGTPVPNTLGELFAALAPTSIDDAAAEFWFEPHYPVALPAPDPAFRAALAGAGLTLAALEVRALFPARFNARLAGFGNKAAVQVELVAAALRQALMDVPGDAELTVDRLGGRKNYLALAEGLADGGFVHTRSETPAASEYVWSSPNAGDVALAFRVKADSASLPVALASIAAKFLREACMAGFNAWWQGQLPGLRPTAGYPEDALRFLADLVPVWDGRTPPRSSLWREK